MRQLFLALFFIISSIATQGLQFDTVTNLDNSLDRAKIDSVNQEDCISIAECISGKIFHLVDPKKSNIGDTNPIVFKALAFLAVAANRDDIQKESILNTLFSDPKEYAGDSVSPTQVQIHRAILGYFLDRSSPYQKTDQNPKVSYRLQQYLGKTNQATAEVEEKIMNKYSSQFFDSLNKVLQANSKEDAVVVTQAWMNFDGFGKQVNKVEAQKLLEPFMMSHQRTLITSKEQAKSNATANTIIGLIWKEQNNKDRMLDYLQKAEHKNVYAANLLGNTYFNGENVSQNYNASKDSFENASKDDSIFSDKVTKNAYAIKRLGDILLNQKSRDKAKIKYESAVNLGNNDALKSLGSIYQNSFQLAEDNKGWSNISEQGKKDYSKAVIYYLEAKNKGVSGAELALNHLLRKYPEYVFYPAVRLAFEGKALSAVEILKGFGNHQAEALLGMLYLGGEGGVSQNLPEAFRLIEKAENDGNIVAMFFLGFMYYEGLGVQENKFKALGLLKDTAMVGVVPAMLFKADMDSKSQNEKEKQEAEKLKQEALNKLAERRPIDLLSLRIIGQIYLKNKKEVEEGKKLLELAKNYGDTISGEILESFEEKK